MSEAIKDALSKLDKENEEHWTADGLPKVEALGIEGIKRKDITEAAPHFTRENPSLQTEAEVKKEAEEKAKVEPTLEDRLKEAAEEMAEAQKVANKAARDLDKAIAKHDALVRENEAVHGARNSQHDIMDYLAAQRKLREQKAAQ